MSIRGRIRILAPSAIVISCLMAAPALAGNCAEGDCRPAATAAAPQQPLKLNKFRRRPVALGTPARVVKTPKGRYAKVKLTHRSKSNRAESKPQPEPQSQPPQFLPVVVSPEAAAALAMQASVAQAAAQVRVVEADEFNDLDRAAAPLVPVPVPTSVEPPVQTASADDTDEVDRKVNATPATPAATPPPVDRPVTASAMPDLGAWFSHFVAWLGNGLTALFAAVRSLFV